MRVAKTSVGYTGGTGDIFTNCHLLVFACGYLQYHVLLLCNPSYSGEYRINFISSLILPILLRNWSYITEERDIADIRMQKQANDNL